MRSRAVTRRESRPADEPELRLRPSSLRFLIWLASGLMLADVIRMVVLPTHLQSPFQDGFESLVGIICAASCAIAAARSQTAGRGQWALVAAFFGMLAAADLHDLVVGLASPQDSALPRALELLGWCTYLPLGFLVVFPVEEEDRRTPWTWLPALDFLQVALVFAAVFFKFVVGAHLASNEPWTTRLPVDELRNSVLSVGLLLRAGFDPSLNGRRFYGRVGGCFAVVTLVHVLFVGHWLILQRLARPAALLALGLFAALWEERTPGRRMGDARRIAFRWVLGVLPAAGPFLVLAISSSTRIPGQGATSLLLAISIAIFVFRVGAFERQLLAYREHLEDLVAARTAELEGTNKQLESFSYSVSHDLRAPLRAVDGYSALLASRSHDVLDDEGRRLLGAIRENAQRMATLIDDLLQFARSGRAELRKTRLDVSEMVKSVFVQLVGPDDRGRVDFRVADLPAAYGDAALVRQVWTNLLSNALKFSSFRERAVIEVGCRTEDGRVVYFVRDNGAGFDTRYAGRLFGVFQRLHSSSEFPGVGIGLAIVHLIVARHGGTVRAESVVGEGATFSFSL